MTLSDSGYDADDARIKHALATLIDGIPTVGKSEGWERIERRLYGKAKNPSGALRWRTAAVTVAVAAALILGLMRVPEVKAWTWRAVYASRDLGGTRWLPGAGLETIADVPFEILVVDPALPGWTLQGSSVDIRNGVDGVVGLRYKDTTGTVFTLRETRAVGLAEAPDYDEQDPNQFLLKVGRSNVAFFFPGSGFVRASWVTDGLSVEIWSSGEIQALVRLIESLVPYGVKP